MKQAGRNVRTDTVLGVVAAAGLGAAALHWQHGQPNWPLAAAALLWAAAAGRQLLRLMPQALCPRGARPLAWLVFAAPFALGGFYSFLAVPISAYLLAVLIRRARACRGLLLYWNLAAAAVAALWISYSLSFLWAADAGMAAWGAARYLPPALFALCLQQLDRDEQRGTLALVPFAGASMTALSALLACLPALRPCVTVNGRLAGFFAYPNTFAAFLLFALVLTEARPPRRLWARTALDGVLIFGILLSGSRGALVFLLLLLIAVGLRRRSLRFCAGAAGVLTLCILLALAAGSIAGTAAAARSAGLGVGGSTLWGRLLYDKDALRQIAAHPLGLGYYGYCAALGGFQTGVYTVTFVHNDLLQVLLDVGWLPAGLLCAALARTFFAPDTDFWRRLGLFVLLGHSLMDFDFQFLAMWLLLLPLLTLREGRPLRLRRAAGPLMALCSVLLALTLWLGAGEIFYLLGQNGLCLAVTPFHTQALTETLGTCTDPKMLGAAADRILALNPDCSLAHSARANWALSRGDVLTMMREKEKAIACARYSIAEYTDYFDKLYAVYQIYRKSGDADSAEVCREKLLAIPDMLDTLREETDKLAWKITDQPQLALPDAETEILRQLE